MKKILIIGGLAAVGIWFLTRRNLNPSPGTMGTNTRQEPESGGVKGIIREGSNFANSAVDLFNAFKDT